jgi:serine/threonine-protein phosphatase 2A regulatory subunit B'
MTSHSLQAPPTAFVDKIDPFKKGSLKRKQKKSQGSSRYRLTSEVELQPLPLLKGILISNTGLYFINHFV